MKKVKNKLNVKKTCKVQLDENLLWMSYYIREEFFSINESGYF